MKGSIRDKVAVSGVGCSQCGENSRAEPVLDQVAMIVVFE